MMHGGHAKPLDKATVNSSLVGTDAQLAKRSHLATGYRTYAVVYSLEGGAETQQSFFEAQRDAAKIKYKLCIELDSSLKSTTTASVVYDGTDMVVAPDSFWMSSTNSENVRRREYVQKAESDSENGPSPSLAGDGPNAPSDDSDWEDEGGTCIFLSQCTFNSTFTS